MQLACMARREHDEHDGPVGVYYSDCPDRCQAYSQVPAGDGGRAGVGGGALKSLEQHTVGDVVGYISISIIMICMYLSTYLPTYLPTYLLTYLPTYLPTHVANHLTLTFRGVVQPDYSNVYIYINILIYRYDSGYQKFIHSSYQGVREHFLASDNEWISTTNIKM